MVEFCSAATTVDLTTRGPTADVIENIPDGQFELVYLEKDMAMNLSRPIQGGQDFWRIVAPSGEGVSKMSASFPVGGAIKRMLDVAIVILICVPFSVLFVGLVVMMKVTDKGPVFYGHKRIGFNGRHFNCWKFRTMVVNGDEMLDAYLNENPEQREIWLRERKLEQDPRVTPIGRVLRKLSLDELPQLYNVLRGDMSIVGPRPVVLDELNNYATSRQHYLSARPGVTGLWQVSGRSDTTYRERVKLDRYYVSNWNALLDIWILLRTVPAVLASRGAC